MAALSVYDKEKNKDDQDDAHMRELTGISPEEESDMDQSAQEGAAEDSGSKSSAPEALAKKEKGAESPTASKADESESGQIGEGYNPEDHSRVGRGRQLVFGGKGRRRAIFGAGIGGGIIGIIIFGFVSLLPLKIIGIVESLHSRFFSSEENAVQKETNNLVSGLFKINAKQCQGSVVRTGCTPPYMNGTGSPISNLYKVWHNNKLESSLRDTYGIELKYNTVSRQYFLRAPGLSSPAAVDIASPENIFTQVNRTQVRQAVDDAISKESKWKQVILRFKFGKFIEQKFGIKRCLTDLGCKKNRAVESINDTLQKPKRAAQVYIAQRVILPRSQILGTALLCLLGQKDCEPSHATTVPCSEGKDCELNGEAETQGQREMRTTLDKLVARYLTDDAFKLYQDVADNGLGNYFVKQLAISLVGQAGGDEAAQQAAAQSVDKALPVIGWVNLASQIIGGLQKLGPAAKAAKYAIGAAAMVGVYMTYRTYADQLKAGHVDPNEAGSFNDSLGPGYHNPDGLNAKGIDPNQVGGTATAEASPVYDQIVNGSSGSSSTGFTQPSKVYAASIKPDPNNISGTNSCNDGSIPSTGKVCSEEQLNGGNATLSSISDQLNSGDLAGIGTLASVWNGTVGKGLGFVGSVISGIVGNIPGFSDALSYVSSLVGKLAQPIFKIVANFVFPNPLGTDMSGARTFNLMAGGADVSGNDFAHHGLGAQAISSQQAANIVNEQTAQAKYEFQKRPFLARMFSKDSQFSLVSRMAMTIPLDKSSAVNGTFSSIVSNPFDKLIHGLASVFTPGKAEAASTSPDPFGITQYGYPDNQIPTDPETYWNQNCQDSSKTQAWNQDSVNSVNQDNGQLENTNVDPCLLIQSTVGSDGGYYSTDVLTPDDLSGGAAATQTTPSTAPTSPTGYKNPLRDVKGLSPTRIDQGVDYHGVGPIYALGNGTVIDASSGAGWPGGGWISYQLKDGPAAGKFVYFAEDCTPTIGPGQSVTADTVICNMFEVPKGPGIETGWAEPGFGEHALAHAIYHENLSTQLGINFSQLLQSLGAPPGHLTSDVSNIPLPNGWPTWQ